MKKRSLFLDKEIVTTANGLGSPGEEQVGSITPAVSFLSGVLASFLIEGALEAYTVSFVETELPTCRHCTETCHTNCNQGTCGLNNSCNDVTCFSGKCPP